jgi:RHS repeat-associated protein
MKNWQIVNRYVWLDQLRLGAELDADGKMVKQFIYADSVNVPEHMIMNGRKYLFIKDHRGSVNMVVDSVTGEIKQQIKYSEFGEVLQDTNPGFQPFGFAGGLYDYETKLVRFGARDYDGKIGRWLSKDPIRFDGGTPNLYEYTFNDPVNFVDPEGKIAWAPFVEWLVITVGKQIAGYPLKKIFTDKPISPEEQEIKDMYWEEYQKRKRDREQCGITMSCTPEPKMCPGQA